MERRILKWIEENSYRPLWFGIDWTIVYVLEGARLELQPCKHDGLGGQPWRKSKPDSLELREVGDIEAVTHILWISTC